MANYDFENATPAELEQLANNLQKIALLLAKKELRKCLVRKLTGLSKRLEVIENNIDGQDKESEDPFPSLNV